MEGGRAAREIREQHRLDRAPSVSGDTCSKLDMWILRGPQSRCLVVRGGAGRGGRKHNSVAGGCAASWRGIIGKGPGRCVLVPYLKVPAT